MRLHFLCTMYLSCTCAFLHHHGSCRVGLASSCFAQREKRTSAFASHVAVPHGPCSVWLHHCTRASCLPQMALPLINTRRDYTARKLGRADVVGLCNGNVLDRASAEAAPATAAPEVPELAVEGPTVLLSALVILRCSSS